MGYELHVIDKILLKSHIGKAGQISLRIHKKTVCIRFQHHRSIFHKAADFERPGTVRRFYLHLVSHNKSKPALHALRHKRLSYLIRKNAF